MYFIELVHIMYSWYNLYTNIFVFSKKVVNIAILELGPAVILHTIGVFTNLYKNNGVFFNLCCAIIAIFTENSVK